MVRICFTSDVQALVTPAFGHHSRKRESQMSLAFHRSLPSSQSVSMWKVRVWDRCWSDRCQRYTEETSCIEYPMASVSSFRGLWLLRQTLVSGPHHCVSPSSCLRSAKLYLIFRFITGFCSAAFLAVAGGTVSDLFSDATVARYADMAFDVNYAYPFTVRWLSIPSALL